MSTWTAQRPSWAQSSCKPPLTISTTLVPCAVPTHRLHGPSAAQADRGAHAHQPPHAQRRSRKRKKLPRRTARRAAHTPRTPSSCS